MIPTNMEKKERKWYTVTLLRSRRVASNIVSLTFSAPEWPGHLAGQHCDVRLTASDGGQAKRDYSIASPPEEKGKIELGVELLPDGEVSPYLFSLKEGEQIEVAGPGGRHFVWEPSMEGPLVLIGGGAGIVPLMSMLRQYCRQENRGRGVILIESARTFDRLPYQEELEQIKKSRPDITIETTITGEAPADWVGQRGRLNEEVLKESLAGLRHRRPNTYVCGPTAFVEHVSNILVGLGFPPEVIRTERFGGTSEHIDS